MKSLAITAETVIFLWLGTNTVEHIFDELEHIYPFRWDAAFVISTVLTVMVVRFLVVFALTFIANKNRIKKIQMREQFVLGYGGLRGAIAFALAFLIPNTVDAKGIMLTATLAVIWWTVFIQGATIKPILALLGIELASDDESMAQKVFSRTFDQLKDGLKDIVGGNSGFFGWRHAWKYYTQCIQITIGTSIEHYTKYS